MIIYDQIKTRVLENPDLQMGRLVPDKLLVRVVPEQKEVKETFHYKVVKEYANGGREVQKVIDNPYVPNVKEHAEYKDIMVFVPYTAEEILQNKKTELRQWRQQCFEIIDRATWFASLTEQEKLQVINFRKQLLDITITLTKPVVPNCVQVSKL